MAKRAMSIGLMMLLSIATIAQNETNQQPTTASAKLNAAVLYRLAIEELQRALPVSKDAGKINMPDDLDDENGPDFTSESWRETVRKAAVGITLFEQASQIPTCNFDKTTDSIVTEFVSNVAHFGCLRTIVEAHAYQRIKTDPCGAAGTAIQLIQHAAHCSQEPFIIAQAICFQTEKQATKLLQVTLKHLSKLVDSQVATKRLLKQLEQHMEARPSRAKLADISEREFASMLQHGFAVAQKSEAMTAACKRATEIHREMTLPLRKNPPVSVAALQAHTKNYIARLKKLTNEQQVAAILKSDNGETLAAALVLSCAVDSSRVLESCLEAGAALEECRQELHTMVGQ